ncbi:MAG: Hsp20/alpha crystallin family protein [Candidatus Binatia bacterium]
MHHDEVPFSRRSNVGLSKTHKACHHLVAFHFGARAPIELRRPGSSDRRDEKYWYAACDHRLLERLKPDDMKWDFFASQQASNLMEQADRIERNFLQIAAGHHLALNSPAAASAPPVNVVETDQACWVITALPGADADRIDIRLQGNELIIAGMRRLPTCCAQGELKIWEIPLGRFERRLRLTPGVTLTIGDTRFEDGLFIAQINKRL